jgi:hypothetical protein
MSIEQRNREKNQYEWREIISEKREFCGIVKLLVDFDEKTERFRRYAHPETHYMRKAVGVADPAFIRIFIRDCGGYVYHIVSEINTDAGFMSTFWIHEDGIRAEREILKDQLDHPVHSIVCVSDLYEYNSEPVDPLLSGVGEVTIELMAAKEP